jgi:hypothetical protein
MMAGSAQGSLEAINHSTSPSSTLYPASIPTCPAALSKAARLQILRVKLRTMKAAAVMVILLTTLSRIMEAIDRANPNVSRAPANLIARNPSLFGYAESHAMLPGGNRTKVR